MPDLAFDQRHGLTRELAQHLRDPGRAVAFGTPVCRGCGNGCSKIVTGYKDANDAERLRQDPAFQLLADQPLVQPLVPTHPQSLGKDALCPRDRLLTMAGSMPSCASAESRFGNAAKSCSVSIPPTIPPTDSNS